MPRRAPGHYPSDASDEEWAFCAPYLTLMREDAPQREYPLRALFNALRYFVRAGCTWRMLPNDLPPWWVVHQQARRWFEAGVFETMAKDLRMLLRVVVHERNALPTAAIFEGRTLQSTPESGARAGYDGYKRRKGSKVHAAVDTFWHCTSLRPANRIEAKSKCWLHRSKSGRARMYAPLLSIRATRATLRRKPRRPKGSSCTS